MLNIFLIYVYYIRIIILNLYNQGIQRGLLAKDVILMAAFAFAIVSITYSYPAIGEIDTKDYSATLAWGSGGTTDGKFNVHSPKITSYCFARAPRKSMYLLY
jgi:hypothetical protein